MLARRRKRWERSLTRLKKDKGNGTLVEEVNLFKVHGTHIWNYPNETPLSLMYVNSKIKLNFQKRVEAGPGSTELLRKLP
jgi:hypothetical protein